MALSALLLLLPILLNVQKIPDESVQSDLNAVYSAISSIDQKDTRNSLGPANSQLTEPQIALFKMHWELETIQKEKPGAPPQFDMGLFAEALEAMVEMDEEAKEVKLREDKLNKWAGIEEQKENAKGSEKEKPTEVPEVRVNANGNIEVKNGAGGDGRMEVKRRKDENGNEEVVVTFVKDGQMEGKSATVEEEKKPQQGQKEKKDNADEEPKMDKANSAKSNGEPMASSYPSALSGEKEEDKKNRKEEKNLGNTMEDYRNPKRMNEGQFEIVERQKIGGEPTIERDFVGGWFGSPFHGHGPIGSFFKFFFGRKKRETVATENVQQKRKDGKPIDIFEKLTTTGEKRAEIREKMIDLAIHVDRDGEKTAEGDDNETKRQRQAKNGGEGGKEQQQNERKREIKQYLDQGVANADGHKKWEKLAYVWYSEQLYWTAKWIEALKNRMTTVNPELAQQFLFSNTGLAAYKEIKDEMAKCEKKLAKLKEWMGENFK